MKNLKTNPNIFKNKTGSAMLLATIVFMFLSLSLLLGTALPASRAAMDANRALKSRQSYFTSESGAEDVFYRYKNSMTVASTNTLTLAGSTATTTAADIGLGQKHIVTTGDYDNLERKTDLVITTGGTGISFNYGAQVGDTGLTMANNTTINGSVYSNGLIDGTGILSVITGSALAANGSVSGSANQANGGISDGGSPPCATQFFMQGSTSSEDAAQSFVVDVATPVNQIDLFLRRVGPVGQNITIKITNNKNGQNLPGDTMYSTGTISASSLGTTFAWFSVPINPVATLTPGTTYWIVLDVPFHTAGSPTSYYELGADNTGAYSSGSVKHGKYGGANSTWGFTPTSCASGSHDAYFRVYVGSALGLISDVSVGSAGGMTHANTVQNTTANGALYCQNGAGNNKSTPKRQQLFLKK